MRPHMWTLAETIRQLKSRTLSTVEYAEWMLNRVERHANLRAYITVSDQVLEQARAIDAARSAGRPTGPLAGALIAVKDLFDTSDLPTTYGGLHFAAATPAANATAVDKLLRAGAIIIGKTNLHEYAYGTTSENPHYGPVRNPWNRSKVAGGSSGGSSAALVAGLCTAAIGTDTGGSIRIPAALCGHVGLKPSYGLVSKAGVFPLAPSLDHVGPMTRCVDDAALLLSVLAGYDPRDPDSSHVPPRDYAASTIQRTLRLGIPRQFFFDKCHPGVLQVVHSALNRLKAPEFELAEVDVPDIHNVPEMQNAIISSEAFAVHRELFSTKPELYGEDVRRRLAASAEVPGHAYVSALQFRQRFRHGLEQVFNGVDALVTPTTALPATDVGQWKAHVRTQEVNIRAHLTRFTNPWNLSGLPAVSIPCGLTPDGLPVGLQLVGPMFSEPKLLSIARVLEEVLAFVPVAPEYR